MSPRDILAQGFRELSIEKNPDIFMAYLELLIKWNKSFNLTAIRDLESMVTRHILDSLSILPWVQGSQVLDVGSGAGFPGIPLSLALPDSQFTLLDSNGKKTRFLEAASRSLRLDNVKIIQSRVEDFKPPINFDTITTRAFSDLPKMINLTQHLLAPSGRWLAMKGRSPKEDLEAIDHHYEVMPYTVFGIREEERCCVIVFS